MPRIADASLQDRILDATYRLLRCKGLEGVTLRAVAQAAGTTTPTVYGRFATKEDLVLAVADKIRTAIVARIVASRTVAEAVRVYLDYAVENPHDYKLLFEVGYPRVFARVGDQPGQVWLRENLAALHGGDPETFRPAAEAIWMELHGAASFIAHDPKHAFSQHFYKACTQSCAVIAAEAKRFSNVRSKA